MTELFIFAVFIVVLIVLYAMIKRLYKILHKHSKRFRRTMRLIFESCPMWWN